MQPYIDPSAMCILYTTLSLPIGFKEFRKYTHFEEFTNSKIIYESDSAPVASSDLMTEIGKRPYISSFIHLINTLPHVSASTRILDNGIMIVKYYDQEKDEHSQVHLLNIILTKTFKTKPISLVKFLQYLDGYNLDPKVELSLDSFIFACDDKEKLDANNNMFSEKWKEFIQKI